MKKAKKSLLKLIAIVIWPLIVFVIGLTFCRKVPGFRIDKIQSNFAFQDEWVIPLPSIKEQKRLHTIFSQEFQYLASGAQCYAFVSEDGKYVLKFFKIKHLTPKYWLNYFPFPWLDNYRFKKIFVRELKKKETFEGFKMAYEDFKEESGLILVHINKTKSLFKQVMIKDKYGRKHLIDLDNIPFVLQKKVLLIPDVISEMVKKGENAKAVDALVSILRLVQKRCRQGIADRDSGVIFNYGFLDGRPLHIDTGRIIRDEELRKKNNTLREVFRVGKKIDLWLQKQFPTLSPPFVEELQRMINYSEENNGN